MLAFKVFCFHLGRVHGAFLCTFFCSLMLLFLSDDTSDEKYLFPVLTEFMQYCKVLLCFRIQIKQCCTSVAFISSKMLTRCVDCNFSCGVCGWELADFQLIFRTDYLRFMKIEIFKRNCLMRRYEHIGNKLSTKHYLVCNRITMLYVIRMRISERMLRH